MIITVKTEKREYDVLFKLTCVACPEQYDVTIAGRSENIGYVRLRWGLLIVECPDAGGELVYTHEFNDGLQGTFASNSETVEYLKKAAQAIVEWYEKHEELEQSEEPLPRTNHQRHLKNACYTDDSGSLLYIKERKDGTAVITWTDFSKTVKPSFEAAYEYANNEIGPLTAVVAYRS